MGYECDSYLITSRRDSRRAGVIRMDNASQIAVAEVIA